jgi:hypothetical protein
MMRHLPQCALLTVVLGLFATPSAVACDGLGYGYGYGWLYNSLRYEVPHFAAYPPVYYSHPVPRTYGYSPFAYPPHVMTPEIAGEIEPLEITNPHVPSTEKTPADAASDRTAAPAPQPQPLIVINPFVAPSQAVAQQ